MAALLATAPAAAADQNRPADPVDKSAIIGGGNAETGKWPFQVALLRAGWGNHYEAEWCGGSLVDKFHVITAAHCVAGLRESQLRVLSGTQSLVSGGTLHNIGRIRVHPRYDPDRSDYDIAVITLKTPATGIAFFADLMTQAQERDLARPGRRAFVIGWGSMARGGGRYPKILQQVAVPIVSRIDCNDRDSYKGKITAQMICAGYSRLQKDSCDGDSGGPLIVKDEKGRWRLLAGIVSWGAYPCAAANRPGVYSRVAVLNGWAKMIVSGDAAYVARLNCARLKDEGRRSCLERARRAASTELADAR